jgi:hypothetical protein
MRIAHWRGPSQARCANELEFQGARDLSESRKVARGDKKKKGVDIQIYDFAQKRQRRSTRVPLPVSLSCHPSVHRQQISI